MTDQAGRMRTFHLAPAYDNTKRIDEVFMPDIRYAQNENVDRGDLRMQVIERGTSTPIDDAKISFASDSVSLPRLDNPTGHVRHTGDNGRTFWCP